MWGSFSENSRSCVIFLPKDCYRGFGLSLFSQADPKPISAGERKIPPIKAPFWIVVLPACQHVCSCSCLALAATYGPDGVKAGRQAPGKLRLKNLMRNRTGETGDGRIIVLAGTARNQIPKSAQCQRRRGSDTSSGVYFFLPFVVASSTLPASKQNTLTCIIFWTCDDFHYFLFL